MAKIDGLSGAGLFALGLVVGLVVGARYLGEDAGAASHAGADVGKPVIVERKGPGDKPRVARYPVPGGSLYFVEGQEGLVFVPEPVK